MRNRNPKKEKPVFSTRRQFLKRTAAGAAAGIAMTLPFPPAFGKPLRASERIGMGFIGVGGRGCAHMNEVDAVRKKYSLPIEMAAVCDVYRPRLERAKKSFDVPNAYMDYRDLLHDPAVDAVAIATPDHHHGYQAIDAIEAGKDVFCEKPVTHWRQFELTKKLAEAVAKSDRVFLLGTQAMSDSAWHQMKVLVQEGLIGQPIHGETGFFRIGDWGERGMPVDDPDAKPGKDLNWEAFLGDAPKRPFSVDRFFRWRLFEDYASGPVMDLFPHSLTQVVHILDLGFPEKVTALGGIHRYHYELREVPDTFNLMAIYPERVTLAVLGTQGNDFQTTDCRGAGQRQPILRGWDGTLTIAGNKEILFTPVGIQGAKPAQRFPIEHEQDMILYWKHFFDCVRARNRQTWSSMDLAYRTQTILHMAMLSYRNSAVARFDPEKQVILA